MAYLMLPGANCRRWVKLLDAAQQNLKSLANVASGVGQNLNISV